MCVGGLLSLDVVMRGRSVRLGVLDALKPDVFVAGTLNASHTDAAERARHIADGLGRISALSPFAAVEVEPQPTPKELAEALQRSGHFAAYEKFVSGAGAGKLRPDDKDPRLWLPTFLSPALGNPSANTLREFHYQSRCMDMIEKVEKTAPSRQGRQYERVLFTRLENHWLHPHPPLSLLSSSRVWVPAGEDNGGINDRHWLAPRKAASLLMRRWDALLDGTALDALQSTRDASRITPQFLSSEMFLMRFATANQVGFGRFPMLAYLSCCEDIYVDSTGKLIGSDQSADAILSTGEGYERKARTCYQPHCNRKRCPSAPPLQYKAVAKAAASSSSAPGAAAASKKTSCELESARSGFKYDMEGSAAIINAEILNGFEGARMQVAKDLPARVEIVVPLDQKGKPTTTPQQQQKEGEAVGDAAHMYFCFGCADSPRLTPQGNLTAGCLHREGYRYTEPHLKQAISANHACRYFDLSTMHELCGRFSRDKDKPDHRGSTYAEQYFTWYCRGLPKVVAE